MTEHIILILAGILVAIVLVWLFVKALKHGRNVPYCKDTLVCRRLVR